MGLNTVSESPPKQVGPRTTQEEAPCLGVGGNALQKRKSVANTVGRGGSQLRGVEERVDGDNLLKQRGHDT